MEGMSKRIVIGGPAYNMQVSARHCETVSMLAMAFTAFDYRVNVWHRHSSMLPENRQAMMRDCADGGVDMFLSIDSDTYLDMETFRDSAMRLDAWAGRIDDEQMSNVYAVVAPVRQGDGKWNVYNPNG